MNSDGYKKRFSIIILILLIVNLILSYQENNIYLLFLRTFVIAVATFISLLLFNTLLESKELNAFLLFLVIMCVYSLLLNVTELFKFLF